MRFLKAMFLFAMIIHMDTYRKNMPVVFDLTWIYAMVRRIVLQLNGVQCLAVRRACCRSFSVTMKVGRASRERYSTPLNTSRVGRSRAVVNNYQLSGDFATSTVDIGKGVISSF